MPLDAKAIRDLIGYRISALRAFIGTVEERIQALEYARTALTSTDAEFDKLKFKGIEGTDLSGFEAMLMDAGYPPKKARTKGETGMRKAVLDVLETEMDWLTLTPLVDRLEDSYEGTYKDRPSLVSSVSTTLKRLLEDKKILREIREGKKHYGSLKLDEVL